MSNVKVQSSKEIQISNIKYFYKKFWHLIILTFL